MKHGATSEQVKNGGSQRIEVATVIDSIRCIDLFGRHELDGTDQMRLFGRFDVHVASQDSQTEVQNFEHALGGDHHVAGFDIPVNDSLGMRIFKCGCGLPENLDNLDRTHWPRLTNPLRK